MSRLLIHFLVAGSLLAAVAGVAYLSRDSWVPGLSPGTTGEPATFAPPGQGEAQRVRLSDQALRALQLVSKPVRLQSHWRTVQLPGTVVDRPGLSDRGITAPVAGTVAQVHAFPGDTLRPGDKLFTLRLVSEYVQNAQSELFKAAREARINREQSKRLADAGGVVPQARLIELQNQDRRWQGTIQALRHDLIARGLTPQQADGIEEGVFVTEVVVVAPRQHPAHPALISGPAKNQISGTNSSPPVAYEVQELKAELGQQVQAGQLLGYLANHQALFIEGRGFKHEAGLIEQAARQGWAIRVDFLPSPGECWPELEQTFVIRSLGNTMDPISRTFPFFIPLSNQSRTFEREGQTFLAWRFRPGQRVRLHVPVERFDQVIVLPTEAVVREGVEAYVFRQNGDLFERKPVQVLYEDRRHVVIANDGSIAPGLFVAQNAAAALNRALKAQAASGVPAGVHVHPDGTVHGAH